MKLSDQSYLIRKVIHEAMDGVRADLLFRAAYPDQRYIIVIIRTLLLDVSDRHPNASNIRRRLLFDNDYMGLFIPLVRVSITETTLLTLLTDTRSDPTLPKRSQRPLQRSYLSRVLRNELSKRNQVNRRETIIQVHLYLPNGTKCTCSFLSST